MHKPQIERTLFLRIHCISDITLQNSFSFYKIKQYKNTVEQSNMKDQYISVGTELVSDAVSWTIWWTRTKNWYILQTDFA